MSRIKRNKNSKKAPVLGSKLGLAGKVKTGEKRVNAKGKEYPSSTDYFRPHCSNKEYEQLFHNAFGENPTQLKIVFISDDINHVCREELELRDHQGKLFARGDGENFEIIFEGKVQKRTLEQILEKNGTIEAFKEKMVKLSKSPIGWREKLTLRFMLPDIKGLFAEWEYSTYAKATTIPQVVEVFDSIQNSAKTIRMIPFDLNVKKVTSDKSGDNRSYPVVSLVPNLTFENVQKIKQLAQANQVSLEHGIMSDEKIKLLSSGESDDNNMEEAEVVEWVIRKRVNISNS